jgi:hypothetical protein
MIPQLCLKAVPPRQVLHIPIHSCHAYTNQPARQNCGTVHVCYTKVTTAAVATTSLFHKVLACFKNSLTTNLQHGIPENNTNTACAAFQEPKQQARVVSKQAIISDAMHTASIESTQAQGCHGSALGSTTRHKVRHYKCPFVRYSCQLMKYIRYSATADHIHCNACCEEHRATPELVCSDKQEGCVIVRAATVVCQCFWAVFGLF